VDATKATKNLADWEDIVQAVSESRCVLFLGPGIHYPPPPDSGYEHPEEEPPFLAGRLAAILAEETGFLSEFPNESSHDLLRVAQWYELKFGRRRLIDRIHSPFATRPPSLVLKALAALPFTCIVTSCFDQLFEQALSAAGKEPVVRIYDPQPTMTKDIPDRPNPERPWLYKAYGDIGVPESIVITQDDFLQHAMRMGDVEDFHPVPLKFRFTIREYPTLCLGWTFRDFHLRFFWNTIRRNTDPAHLPRTYALDLFPDPLLLEMRQRYRDLFFVEENIWTFVPQLHRAITGTALPT
jgi:hypothetical protein